jgi:branched-chain amino acid transport system substrate-binding protein
MMKLTRFTRSAFAVASLAAAVALALPAHAQKKDPIVIGGTLGLTGAFAEPSTDYKAVYDIWLEQVNKKGGCWDGPSR